MSEAIPNSESPGVQSSQDGGVQVLNGEEISIEDDEAVYGSWRTKVKKPVYKGPKSNLGFGGGVNNVKMTNTQFANNLNRVDNGMQFQAGSSKSQIGRGNGKDKVKFATKAPAHFRDLADHNVFGDLDVDVSDSIIDLEAAANALSWGEAELSGPLKTSF
ncbi:hypothetical protein M5689_020848 [Euphorbia peplus]|nr:hypothetical protein M5689_020848 [Euphorbia peplus]